MTALQHGVWGDPVATAALLARAQALRVRCGVSESAMADALGVARNSWRAWKRGVHGMRRRRQRDVGLRLGVLERLYTDRRAAALRRMGPVGRYAAFRKALPSPDEYERLGAAWGLYGG